MIMIFIGNEYWCNNCGKLGHTFKIVNINNELWYNII